MSVVILLMICSICVAGGFLWAYLWSVKKGQFDDLEASGFRILHDTTPKKENNHICNNNS
jgi:cbb3-type cytochrome oxidase maturation protein